MAFMTWNDQFTTGIVIVDQQHRGLVDLVNQAAPTLAAASRENLRAIEPLLDQLIAYATTHFRTEETLMENHNIDPRHLEHHRQSHAAFVRQVNTMGRSLLGGGVVTGNEMLTFLANWLIFHILGEDQAMARQIKAIASGQTSIRAFESGGAQRDPAQSALTRSLVDLYTLLTEQNRDLLETNTRLQATQAELRQSERHLEELVRDRTAQLEAANAELVRARDAAEMASRAKSTFLSTMSHEIRTPMNAIIGFAHLLERGNLSPRYENYAHLIGESAQQLLGMVNDVLEFSRIETGDIAIHEEGFPVSAVLDPVYVYLCAQGEAKGLQVMREFDPTLPGRLRGDASSIEKVLRKFASNAVKFTDRGSVTFRTQFEEAGERDLRVRFEIADTGIGIHPEQQTRLFQAFEQVDGSLTRRHGGMGLGLAIAHRLARMIGGEIGVDSQPGLGSRFWLMLRLGRLVDDVSEPEVQIACESGNALLTVNDWLSRIEALLVDDDLRANRVFAEGAALVREALGEYAEIFAQQMADYQ
jgi:hemerythrin-like metal-binding protein